MSQITIADLDDVEIVRAVEDAFKIKITDAEAAACETVGDLFNVVKSKVRIVDRGAERCLTATAFWRLQSAFLQENSARWITPATPLSVLMPARNRGMWWRKLSLQSGLALPHRPSRQLGVLPRIFFGASAGVVAFVCNAELWSALIAYASFLLADIPGSGEDNPTGINGSATVGDLAKITAYLNAGHLAGPSGEIRSGEAWQAYEGVIRHFGYFRGPIDKRTRFRCV